MIGSRGVERILLMGMVAAAIFFAASPAVADEEETLQRATDKAVARIGEELAKAKFPGIKRVAVVPLRADAEGYATNSIKSAVTKTSYDLFARSDETWDTLLAEIEWGVRREDVMDPKTVQKFGKIKGVDAIMFGQVLFRRVNLWSIRGQIKVSVHLADVETGQVVWSSGTVEGEAYLHWSYAVTRFWRYPILIVGAFIALIVLWLILRGIRRGIRHSTRPL